MSPADLTFDDAVERATEALARNRVPAGWPEPTVQDELDAIAVVHALGWAQPDDPWGDAAEQAGRALPPWSDTPPFGTDPLEESRREFKDAARAAAFLVAATADQPAQLVLHSFRGFLGAEWRLAGVIEAIDTAARVRWAPNQMLGHELEVTEPDGRRVYFAVRAPADAR